ncbi:hypothetical protein F5Y04DRAFT_287885 [Hypomontagnella monticulosa]|nr:hypothetical protein F5Y04DRAFT_287885 [Hypomontagnella monticulosa]
MVVHIEIINEPPAEPFQRAAPRGAPWNRDGLTLYEVLEIPDFSTVKTVRSAYRRQLKKYHPDKVKESERQEAAEKMVLIREAYDILSSKERCLYDYRLGDDFAAYIACSNSYVLQEVEDLQNELERKAEERKEARRRQQIKDDNHDGESEEPEESAESDGSSGLIIWAGGKLYKPIRVVRSMCGVLWKWLASWF